MEDEMKRKEAMTLVRIEKTQVDNKKGRRTVRVYENVPGPELPGEILKWVITIVASIAIGVHWGTHL